MPYSKFTIERLEKELNLQLDTNSNFFEDKKVKPSDWLKLTLDKTMSMPLTTEKARSEFIITPILLEMSDRNDRNFNIFSGNNLDVDIEKDLNGECDFILTKSKNRFTIHSPIFGLVEAKKQDIDLGLAQCIAQMIGAYIFNEREESNIKTIFGCVTTGEIWQFMRLEYLNENYVVKIENKKYYIDNLESILGAIQQIMDFYK